MTTSSLTIASQPQRPATRTARIHDENMPLHITNGPIGKSLHQRTKSASTLNLRKPVLGEVNTNEKLGPKDDSEIGKTSPGKMKFMQEQPMPAPLQRPAVRPLAPKSTNMQMAAAQAAATSKLQGGQQEPVQKKLVGKKSTKVLKDPAPVQLTEVEVPQVSIAYPQDRTTSEPYAVQQYEVRKTETIPLRDDSSSAPQHHVPSTHTTTAPALSSQQQHVYAQTHLQQAAMGAINTVNDPTEPIADYDDHPEGYTTARSLDVDPTQEFTTILNPAQSQKAATEIAEAQAYVESTRTSEDIEDEQWDTSMVAEYGDEIFDYMRHMETRMSPNPQYMELQHEIQWSMRGVLMDWVVQVHQRFNLLPETLFLTVNYIDRFLSCKIVSLGKLQLVGATAIFVAAKYEEVNCPTIAEIIYMVDNGYTADELLKAERFMLSMLQFELGWPGPMSFLRRISKADDYDLETRTLAKYFLEVTIMDERFVGCKPSFLAAGAHCMARLMLLKGDWTQAHVYYSNYTFRQLHHLLAAIWECCKDAQQHHNAVFEKYTDKRYKRASTFVRGEMQRGFVLPFRAYAGFTSLGAHDSSMNWFQQ